MAHATDALLAGGVMLANATGTVIPLPDGRGTRASIQPVNGYSTSAAAGGRVRGRHRAPRGRGRGRDGAALVLEAARPRRLGQVIAAARARGGARVERDAPAQLADAEVLLVEVAVA